LVSTNCSGTDSSCSVLTVINPPAVPLSDFVASPSIVNTYQTVSLTDLSTNGPTTWIWSISPGSLGVDYFYTNGTSSSSKNPAIYFATSGIYNVCLMASNGLGSDINRCKTNYLDVRAAQSMCVSPFSTNVSMGNIFSSGGAVGGYGQNENCTFVIDACADSTYLNITTASFGSGTIDRLEIYQGDYINGVSVPVAQFVAPNVYPNLPQVVAVKGKIPAHHVRWSASTKTGQSHARNLVSEAARRHSPVSRGVTRVARWARDRDGVPLRIGAG